MIPFFTFLALMSSIYLFSSSIELIFLINFSIFFLLSIFNEKYFIVTYIAYLLSYKFLIPYQSIDSLLELLPVFINCILVIPIFLKSKNIKIYKKGLVFNLFNPIIFILLTQFLSFLINQSSLFELLRWYLWILNTAPLFLYVYYCNLDSKLLVNIAKKLIILFFLIQIPVVMMQYGSTPLNYSSNPDTFSGTLGPAGTALLSFLCCILFYPVAFKALMKKEFLYISLLIPLIVLLTVVSDILFTIVVCALFPFLILVFKDFFEITISKKFLINSILLTTIVILFFSSSRISGILNILDAQENTFNSNRLNIEELSYYSNMITSNEDGLKFGRTLGLVFSFNTILDSKITNQLFGYGPGSTRSEQSIVQRAGPPKIRPVPHTNFFGADMIILEFGFIGFFALLYLFYSIYKFTLNSKSSSDLNKIFLLLLFIYFIYGLVYDGGWFFNPSKNGIFWIITAIIFSSIDQENFKKNYIPISKKN